MNLKITRTYEISYTQNTPTLHPRQSVEISREAIEAGILKNLPGSLLSVYLYLLTHVNENFTLTTTIDKIIEFLPYSPIEIETALTLLDKKGYIKFKELENKNILISLILKTDDINSLSSSSFEMINSSQQHNSNENTSIQRNNELLDYILKQKAVSEQALVRAISAMIPAQQLNYGFRQEIEYWLKTFDKNVIKELIRRTDEAWQRDPSLNCQAYMRKIANDWITEQIFTLEDLEKSDKIYREVKSLLEEFGLDRQKEMTRTHWETVFHWVNSLSEEDFALSIDVAKFAIQEAIKRKSDGRPSLNYIEDNFIKPFKHHKIKTIEEARAYLASKTANQLTNKTNPSSKTNNNKNKWQLGIDFTRFREN